MQTIVPTIENKSVEKYPAYQDSGVDWLGEIPEHWMVTAIKFILSIPITDGPHTTPELLETGIPFISAEAIKNGEIDFGKKRGLISLKDHLLFSQKYSPRKGDIFMVKSGATTGNVAINRTDKDFSIWSPLAVFRANKEKILSIYLYYVLQSSSFRKGIELSWSFGTQQNIGMGILSNLPIAFGTIEEQTRIAHFLDRKTAQIDQAIRIKEKQIALLKERRQILIHNAVTRGLQPNVPMKDSGVAWIGEIPKHWEVKKLKFILKSQGRIGFKGYTTSDLVEKHEGALTLGATHLDWEGNIDLSNPVYISWRKYFESPEIMVSKNDIIIVQRGSTCGKVAMIREDFGPTTINPSLVLLKEISETPEFVFLGIKIVLNGILNLVSSTAIPMLSQFQINNIKIPLPNAQEQSAIIKFINDKTSQVDKAITCKQKEIEKLKEYKTTLINSAVTGKIKVE